MTPDLGERGRIHLVALSTTQVRKVSRVEADDCLSIVTTAKIRSKEADILKEDWDKTSRIEPGFFSRAFAIVDFTCEIRYLGWEIVCRPQIPPKLPRRLHHQHWKHDQDV